MAFTMPDFPMLNQEQASPYANLVSNAMKSYQDAIASRYMPQKIQTALALQMAQAKQASSEAQKNQFLVQNPQYISTEGMLISQSMRQNGYQGGGMPQPNSRIGNSGVTPLDQQNIDALQPGQSYVIGSGQAPGDYGQQTAQGQPNQKAQGSQQAGASAQMPTADQYDQNAMAFNPPQLPSPTGNPQLDNLWFKKFGMSPLLQAQMDLSTKQAEKYQDQAINRNKEFNDQAQIANQSTIDAHKFLNALDEVNSLQTGYFGGQTPAITDATQRMDSSGNAMAASATSLFKNGGAIHDSDITLQQLAKPNRKQNPDVSFDLAQGIIAKNDRLKERQLFYSLGTQMRLKPEILDAEWNKYETERPYLNSDTNMPNDAYKGTWKDYLTPQSINAFVKGEDYKQPNQKALNGMNWTDDDLKKFEKIGKQAGYGKGEIKKQELYKLAKKEGKNLSQVKLELMKAGVL